MSVADIALKNRNKHILKLKTVCIKLAYNYTSKEAHVFLLLLLDAIFSGRIRIVTLEKIVRSRWEMLFFM
jgi:hypothetical protein